MYTRYDIFDDLLGLKGEVERFFSENPLHGRRYDLPYVNVYETGDDLQVRAMVPGVQPGDVDIQLVDNSLIIEGEKKSDYSDRPYIRKERSFGKFKKSIRLPFRVDPGKINAGIKNGILTVKLVKSEDAKPRKISIG